MSGMSVANALECTPSNNKERAQQAGEKFFNSPSLQQSLSEMSQPKATLSPREENQLTALLIFFYQFCNVNLPSNINRAAMLRLKGMDILSDKSDTEANIPTAHFTEYGIRYVLNLVNNIQKELIDMFFQFSPSCPRPRTPKCTHEEDVTVVSDNN